MKVLVTGAGGFIGSRLVIELLSRGHEVRCASRRPESLSLPSKAQTIRADLLDPTTLKPALRNVEAAYYLVHSMEKGAASFAERDRQAARNFSAAAASEGVKRIIYLGGLGEAGKGLSEHLASRMEVGRILSAGPVPLTVLRAAVIVGAGGSSFEMIEALVRKLPVMICPRWVKTLCQPIAVDDVIQYLADCLSHPATAAQTYDIGGPDVLTYRQMMEGLAAVFGLSRWIVEVPVLTPHLSSYWVNLVTPVPTNLSRPLIDGLKNNVVCHDTRIQDIMPHRCLSYRESIERALAEKGQGRIVREGRGYRLTWFQWIRASPDEIMEFFSDPKNLAPMTPPNINFKLLEPYPTRLSAMEKLNYRIRILGVPIRWTTKILTWDPPNSFSDTQSRGPYRQWLHKHKLTPQAGGTLTEDDVFYELPLGPLGHLAHPWLVSWQLRKIFDYRCRQMPRLLRAAHPMEPLSLVSK